VFLIKVYSFKVTIQLPQNSRREYMFIRLNTMNSPNPVGILCKKTHKITYIPYGNLGVGFHSAYKHTFPTGIWTAAE
jgi:hypothetical protein